MYDVVIIGSGPAGMAAAVYAARAELSFIVIEKESAEVRFWRPRILIIIRAFRPSAVLT